MFSGWDDAGPLLSGKLRDARPAWPFTLTAVLCDLRLSFLEKYAVGRGYRAVARNGRVLLCGDRPLAEWIGEMARVRLQTWNRSILPGDAPHPYGILLCVRRNDSAVDGVPLFTTRLGTSREAGDLVLEVGGLRVLQFQRAEAGG